METQKRVLSILNKVNQTKLSLLDNLWDINDLEEIENMQYEFMDDYNDLTSQIESLINDLTTKYQDLANDISTTAINDNFNTIEQVIQSASELGIEPSNIISNIDGYIQTIDQIRINQNEEKELMNKLQNKQLGF